MTGKYFFTLAASTRMSGAGGAEVAGTEAGV